MYSTKKIIHILRMCVGLTPPPKKKHCLRSQIVLSDVKLFFLNNETKPQMDGLVRRPTRLGGSISNAHPQQSDREVTPCDTAVPPLPAGAFDLSAPAVWLPPPDPTAAAASARSLPLWGLTFSIVNDLHRAAALEELRWPVTCAFFFTRTHACPVVGGGAAFVLQWAAGDNNVPSSPGSTGTGRRYGSRGTRSSRTRSGCSGSRAPRSPRRCSSAAAARSACGCCAAGSSRGQEG